MSSIYLYYILDPTKELNTSDPWKFKSQLKSCLGLYFKVVGYIVCQKILFCGQNKIPINSTLFDAQNTAGNCIFQPLDFKFLWGVGEVKVMSPDPPPQGKGPYGPFSGHSRLLHLQQPLITNVIETPGSLNISNLLDLHAGHLPSVTHKSEMAGQTDPFIKRIWTLIRTVWPD